MVGKWYIEIGHHYTPFCRFLWSNFIWRIYWGWMDENRKVWDVEKNFEFLFFKYWNTQRLYGNTKKNQLRIFWAQKNLFHSFLSAFWVPLKFNIDKLLRDFFLLFIHIIRSCLANHSVCRCTLGKNHTVLIQSSAILIYNSIRLIQFSNSAI